LSEIEGTASNMKGMIGRKELHQNYEFL